MTDRAAYLRAWRANGGAVKRDPRRSAARGRALAELRRRHPREFAGILARELGKDGLRP